MARPARGARPPPRIARDEGGEAIAADDAANDPRTEARAGLLNQTAVVAVIERVRHPKYAKFVMRTKKLYAHDEANDANIGDRVRVMETRPLSKTKRWRLVEILERAK